MAGNTAGRVKVRNSQPRTLTARFGKKPGDRRMGGVVTLQPGDNLVASELVLQALEHAQFQAWQRAGWVVVEMTPELAAKAKEVLAPGKAKRAEQAAEEAAQIAAANLPESLKDMSAKDAIAFVASVEDVEKLDGWLSAEERSTVTKAIAERLKELGAGAGESTGSESTES